MTGIVGIVGQIWRFISGCRKKGEEKRDRVTKQIVCLANSRMKGNRCIAGKEIGNGSWIRPVSTYGEGLLWRDYRYEDGRDPKLLDIIGVPLVEHCPQGHQSENWLIDSGVLWTRAGRISWNDLAGLADDPVKLWENKGWKNDRVSSSAAKGFSRSLYFIQVTNLVLEVCRNYKDNPQVRGKFSYRDFSYNLVVTDSMMECTYKSNDLMGKKYLFRECYVAVSLAAEPRDDDHYKLIAGIITPNRVGDQIDV